MHYTISATDARRLMRGDGIALWKEKKGLQAPENLSHVLRVQMGIATEELNLNWWEMNNDAYVVARNVEMTARMPSQQAEYPMVPIDLPGAFRIRKPMPNGGVYEYVSLERDWQTFTPDGIVLENGNAVAVIDAKHTRALDGYNEPHSVVQVNYWQFVHQMMVSGLDRVHVSVFYGNDEWRQFTVLRKDDDAATLLGAEMLFLKELESDTSPGFVIEAPADHPIPGVPTRKLLMADVEQANWGADYIAAAGEFLSNYDSDKRLDAAKKALRGFLPVDAVKIEAFGVRVNRTQRGIVITSLKEKAA